MQFLRSHLLLAAVALSVPIPFTPALAADEIHWTMTGPTSVTLEWRGSNGSLRYGLNSSYGLATTAVTPSPLPYSSSGSFSEARLTGLLPNPVYHHSVPGGPDPTLRPTPPRGLPLAP